MEQLLEEARRVADEAEVFSVVQWDEPIVFEANRLKAAQHRETSGLALRIVKDGRVGFSSAAGQVAPQELVARALEMAPFGAMARFEFPSFQGYPHVEAHDPEVERLSQDEMVQVGQELIDRVRAAYPDVQWDARISRGGATVRLVNSQGAQVEHRRTAFSIFLEGTRVRGEDMLFVGEGQSSARPIRDPRAIGDAVLRQLEQAETTVPAPQGQVPVLFTPNGVAGALLEPLLAGFNGRNIVQGTSPLIERLGEKLLDPGLTVLDAPLHPYTIGSRGCDDEGVPCRALPLVQEGVISSFLYDLQTAGQAGTESTGSAQRSLGSLPTPGVSVLMIAPGDAAYEEMLAEVQDGLLVEHLLGAGQGNVLGGDFNANVLLGYRIQGGQIVGRVKNAVIHGNVYKALSSIAGIGKEAQWVGGSLSLPHLLCHGISVSAKE